ncbi:MAG TPA: GNAT family N-acetyltransferase [Mycobacterium sp.]
MELVEVTTARIEDAKELADVAARTFPLACPPTSTPENIGAFIETHLTPERFTEYLADPDRAVLTVSADSRITGYCMLIRGVPEDPDVQRAVPVRPAVELSKMYVLPEVHGAGAATALMTAALDRATAMAARSVWLGVNQHNRRAQRFYAKHGFTIHGAKTFRLGDGVESDFVMVRPL